MLMKTVEAFRDRTTYQRAEHGTWTAEFHGAINIRVEGPSLERCRFLMLDILDAHVHDWLVAAPAAQRSQHSS